ncbi:MAG: hypothetical protein IJS74_00650 [Clostridia bacterium]|nr:hypothetical protein [Clostridia bacterium]
MVQNIAIIGLDRDVAYEVSKMVANQLEMHFLDTIDLFEFDNKPRTLSEMLSQFGIRYFRQKEKGTIKYVTGFTNSVINIESGAAEFGGNLKELKTNCLVIYLRQDIRDFLQTMNKKEFKDEILKAFYYASPNAIQRRDNHLLTDADIVIDIYDQSVLKIASEVLRKIKSFYGVN